MNLPPQCQNPKFMTHDDPTPMDHPYSSESLWGQHPITDRRQHGEALKGTPKRHMVSSDKPASYGGSVEDVWLSMAGG